MLWESLPGSHEVKQRYRTTQQLRGWAVLTKAGGHTETCMRMFAAALRRKAKKWKQHNCPSGWMDKAKGISRQWDGICQYKVMTCYDRDRPGKYYAKGRKPVTKSHMLYVSTY